MRTRRSIEMTWVKKESGGRLEVLAIIVRLERMKPRKKGLLGTPRTDILGIKSFIHVQRFRGL